MDDSRSQQCACATGSHCHVLRTEVTTVGARMPVLSGARGTHWKRRARTSWTSNSPRRAPGSTTRRGETYSCLSCCCKPRDGTSSLSQTKSVGPQAEVGRCHDKCEALNRQTQATAGACCRYLGSAPGCVCGGGVRVGGRPTLAGALGGEYIYIYIYIYIYTYGTVWSNKTFVGPNADHI